MLLNGKDAKKDQHKIGQIPLKEKRMFAQSIHCSKKGTNFADSPCWLPHPYHISQFSVKISINKLWQEKFEPKLSQDNASASYPLISTFWESVDCRTIHF